MANQRLGKGTAKSKRTVFVAVNRAGNQCGHQHSASRSAHRCIANIKQRDPLAANQGWYVRSYLPALDGRQGRREVPQA